MKKLILIYLLLISGRTHSQIDWKNYSTSFNTDDENSTLGVAIPYNGIYDNNTGKIVGIAHWNPKDRILIDAELNDSIPLYFVYDTAGIYFLAPQVNQQNTGDFEYSVLLNNKTVITSWSHISEFIKESIGDMESGSGLMGSYTATWGDYLVAHLRNKEQKIIASWVVYWQRTIPQITSLYTSNNPLEFSQIVKNEDSFSKGPEEIGWHRRYNNVPAGHKNILKLPHNENSILINIAPNIYKKEALEYSLVSDGKLLRDWGKNEYNNSHILLKNLDPGYYVIRIRLKRQPESVQELHFLILPAWYQTAIFKIACLVFMALTLIMGAFLFKYKKQQQTLKKKSKQFEQTAGALKNIQTLLNPHFTFNALSSIQGLINKNNIQAANQYLSSFGDLLRESLKESKLDLIPLEKELKNLSTYIGLEQLRTDFKVNFEISDAINTNTTSIPPFLLQPFAENAIKHGISKSGGNGILDIQILKNQGMMLIKIKDNGPGFDVSSLREGHGLALSKKRIGLLNEEYREEMIRLKMESRNTGTEISLLFLNWL